MGKVWYHKDMRKNKIIQKVGREISRGTVEFLEELSDWLDAFLFSSGSTRLFYQQLYKNKRFRSEKRISERLHSLHKRGYINLKKNKKRISIKLTEKGRIKLLEHSNKNQIDGKWRMISFDIPEELRARRDRFRSAIKRIGFRQVQKSLWACPFVKADGIEKAIRYYQVKDYVAYLIVEKSDIDKYLKNIFEEYFDKRKISKSKISVN